MFDGAGFVLLNGGNVIGFVTLNVSKLGALDREREREGGLYFHDLEISVSKRFHVCDVW